MSAAAVGPEEEEEVEEGFMIEAEGRVGSAKEAMGREEEGAPGAPVREEQMGQVEEGRCA